jgi:hypothetical protein
MGRRGVSHATLTRRRQRAHASCRHRPQTLSSIGVPRRRSRRRRLRLPRALPLRRSAAARADVVPPQTLPARGLTGGRGRPEAAAVLPMQSRLAAGWCCLGPRCSYCVRLLLHVLRLRLRLLRLQGSALPMATQALQNAAGPKFPGVPQQRALPAVPRVVAQHRPLRVPLQLRALALSGSRLRHSASAPRCASASPAPPPSVLTQRGRFETAPPQSGRCPDPVMRQVLAAVPRPGRRHVEAAAPPMMRRSPSSFAPLPPAARPLLAHAPPPPPPPLVQPPSPRQGARARARVRQLVPGDAARFLVASAGKCGCWVEVTVTRVTCTHLYLYTRPLSMCVWRVPG